MGHLQPPHLEMNFYFANHVDEGFISILNGLLALGATYHNQKVTVLRGKTIRQQAFRGGSINPISNEYIVDSLQVSSDGIDAIFNDERIRVAYVLLDNAIGLVKRGEALRYGVISKEASQSDHPPIQIITSGTVFDPIPELKKQARYAGKKVYRQFIKLIEMTRPSYAAITSEYDMECPTDLKRDSRTIAFADFYIDADYIGDDGIRQIKAAYKRGYIEDIANGIYVSSWKFNPKGKIPDKNWQLTTEKRLVANLIAQKAT